MARATYIYLMHFDHITMAFSNIPAIVESAIFRLTRPTVEGVNYINADRETAGMPNEAGLTRKLKSRHHATVYFKDEHTDGMEDTLRIERVELHK
jgi:hypothetical protein